MAAADPGPELKALLTSAAGTTGTAVTTDTKVTKNTTIRMAKTT